ncbi:efflux RND transporter periplasmic adaptor subunit [Alkalimonas amylolytica]|uniref:RND family efflux transporter, MFP subunit n=1 Tax=Alkalimonas amylolytica TaxID=152573 RepID=A0A1H4BU41_ALKAM|nr:efflux RND transporter periplasmic adaptor subunit [Alkalimonas amylolytica]SEA51587.1 RND family efflux transporter, MFP subunit [Alkalimonas amylolytica]
MSRLFSSINQGTAALMALLLLLGLTACSKAPEDEAQLAPVTVKLVMANGDSQLSSRSFVGRVDAVSTVDLAFQVGGQVTKLAVQQGQVVAAGGVLAALDPADYQLALQQARVQLDQAKRDLERARPLREQGILTPSDFEQLQTSYELAKVALENASRNIAHAQLEAPFDALITRRLIERYATVAAGTPVLRVQNISELRVHINVPEQLMRLVNDSADYQVSVRLPGQDAAYPLVYREHATEADPMTQTYRVSFALARIPEVNLMPGMTVSVVTERTQQPSSLSVPLSAIDTATPEQFHVWRYLSDSQTVERVQVQLGQIHGQQVDILSGVQYGDQLVSAGHAQLQPGQRVRPFQAY